MAAHCPRRRHQVHCIYLWQGLLALLLWSSSSSSALAFQGFQLPKIPSFGKPAAGRPGSESIAKQKDALLEAVSNTNNGRTATPEQQAAVLQIVQGLEQTAAVGGGGVVKLDQLLSDVKLARQYIDGVWYLQYTSPSVVTVDGNNNNNDNDDVDAWKPVNAAEGDSNIVTNQVQSKGSISAAGITVDTSNKLVQQIFDVDNSRVTNNIDLDTVWGGAANVKVAGDFRQSPSVPNRAIVAFDTALIRLGGDDEKGGLTINLNGVWPLFAFIRRSKDTGWLETTFIDETLRIGRGNKGTMFVLTRDPDAVTP